MKNDDTLIKKFGTTSENEIDTFRGWIARGRVVNKGEKGTRLVRPVKVGDKDSFRPYYVFHLTQTKPLGVL